MADYADYTYNSSNPLRRFSHRTRFKEAISAIPVDCSKSLRILDYGCGDGMFIHQLRQKVGDSALLVGYEPFMEAFAANNEMIENSWAKILKHVEEKGKFDIVTCFEVLEHLPPVQLEQALHQIHSVVSANGTVIVSVPIKKGFSALVKGCLRRREGSDYRRIWSYSNIWRSLIGKPVNRELAEEGYFHHVGFYFEDLEKQIDPLFHILTKSFSPLKKFNYHFNSQVFYSLKKRI